MTRRLFLKLMSLVGLEFAFAVPGQRPEESELEFFAAGTRFQSRLPVLRAGARLQVHQTEWRGERAYALLTADGDRVGYVPRKLAATFTNSRVRTARVAEFRPYSVPWRRYRVSVELDPA